MRLPTRRSAAGVLEIVVDTRERYAWKFERQQVEVVKRALAVGDYAVELDGEIAGVVERKKLQELASNVVDGSLLVTMVDLATTPRASARPVLWPRNGRTGSSGPPSGTPWRSSSSSEPMGRRFGSTILDPNGCSG
jgi:hypothetical protein